MKLSVISKNLLAVLALLLATAAFAGTKSSLELSDAVTVAGHQLAPGSYQIKWDGAGPNVDLNILSKGKVVATVPAHVVQQDKAGSYDTYRTTKTSDGGLSLTEIRFAGKKYSLAVGDETTAAQKDSNSKTSSN